MLGELLVRQQAPDVDSATDRFRTLVLGRSDGARWVGDGVADGCGAHSRWTQRVPAHGLAYFT